MEMSDTYSNTIISLFLSQKQLKSVAFHYEKTVSLSLFKKKNPTNKAFLKSWVDRWSWCSSVFSNTRKKFSSTTDYNIQMEKTQRQIVNCLAWTLSIAMHIIPLGINDSFYQNPTTASRFIPSSQMHTCLILNLKHRS